MADTNLNVKVTADVTSLAANMAVAKLQLKSAAATVKEIATAYAVAGDAEKAVLAPSLQRAGEAVDGLKVKVAAMNTELRATVHPEVTGFFGGLTEGLNSTAQKVEGLTEKFGAVQRLTSALSEFVLAGLAVDKVAETIDHVAETGEKLQKLSEETGLTTEQLSGLRVMATETGTDFDEFTKLLEKLPGTMQTAAETPTSKAAEAFRAMGVSVTDSTGQLRPLGDVLDDVSAKLSSYADGANKTALETDIFGAKIGASLIPMLNQLGQVGIPGAVEQSNVLAQTWSGADAQAAEKFESDLKRVELGIEGIGTSIVKFALPALDQLAQGFSVMTKTAPIAEQIDAVQASIAAREVNHGRFPGADLPTLNAQLKALQAQQAIIDQSAEAQTAMAGGAAPGTVQAPNLKGGTSLGQRQGAGDTDVADDGDNTDESGVDGSNDQSGVEAARKAQEQITQIAQDAAETRKQVATSEYDAQVSNWNAEVSEGKMTKEQEIQDEISAQDRMYESALAEMEKEAALLPQGTAAKAKALDEIEVLTADHDATLAKLNDDLVTQQLDDAKKIADANQKAADATAAAWQKAFQPISQAFDSSINGILQGTQTLQQAEMKAASSIALAYIDAAAKQVMAYVEGDVQILAHHVAAELGMTAATQAGGMARVAAQQGASVTGKTLDAATSSAQISNSAYTAAAEAYKAVVGIPYVGPVLAPAAAATAFAGVMAFDVLSAEGGMDIGAGVNPVTQLHEKEMVLPASIANPLRASLDSSSGGDTNNGGSMTVTYAPNITMAGGSSTSELDGVLSQQSVAMFNYLQTTYFRNGALTLPGR